ncbi:MAG: DUF3426 domain-containing protein [Pseudomonadota bacterium]|nr:DUF3426 domain-containing protein [Pseudomonadota bacterium]
MAAAPPPAPEYDTPAALPQEAEPAHDAAGSTHAPNVAAAMEGGAAGQVEPESRQAPLAEGAGEPESAQAPGTDREVAVDPEPAAETAPAESTDASAPAAATVPIAPRARATTAPNFTRVRAPVAVADRRPWLLPTLIAVLSLLLSLQWILADRAALAADARWRPFIVQLCGMLRCNLPAWHEPDAFVLLDRDVRPHPTVQGVLRVSATFRNDARWPQPWPEVVLTLSDVEGRAVGARAFAARDYLRATPTQNELASGQSATIRMDVLEPTPRSVAFAFDFR